MLPLGRKTFILEHLPLERTLLPSFTRWMTSSVAFVFAGKNSSLIVFEHLTCCWEGQLETQELSQGHGLGAQTNTGIVTRARALNSEILLCYVNCLKPDNTNSYQTLKKDQKVWCGVSPPCKLVVDNLSSRLPQECTADTENIYTKMKLINKS